MTGLGTVPDDDDDNPRPRPWDPDAVKTGAGFLFITLVLSLVMHTAIPFAGMIWPQSSVSTLPRTVEFFPLPPAEELVDSPDDEDVPEPTTPPEPNADPAPPTPDKPDDKPTKKPPDKKPPPEKEPTPAEDDAEEALDGPDAPPEPTAMPKSAVADAEAAAKLTAAEAQALAARDARQARRAARSARRAARAAAAEASRKGGAPEGGIQGVPKEVHLCNADDKGPIVKVRTQKPVGQWVTVLPSVFAYWPARPSMGSYLEDVDFISVEGKRLGSYDFSTSQQVLQLELESPVGARMAIGRLDARCQIGVKIKRGYFPLVLKRVPVRLIERNNKTTPALVNITIFKDFRIELESYDKRVTLPFTEARLKNQKQIERNIQDHMQAAQMVNAVADFFGMKGKK